LSADDEPDGGQHEQLHVGHQDEFLHRSTVHPFRTACPYGTDAFAQSLVTPVVTLGPASPAFMTAMGIVESRQTSAREPDFGLNPSIFSQKCGYVPKRFSGMVGRLPRVVPSGIRLLATHRKP
jgi:hypothetical protein